LIFFKQDMMEKLFVADTEFFLTQQQAQQQAMLVRAPKDKEAAMADAPKRPIASLTSSRPTLSIPSR
jgi:hypothetical protein